MSIVSSFSTAWQVLSEGAVSARKILGSAGLAATVIAVSFGACTAMAAPGPIVPMSPGCIAINNTFGGGLNLRYPDSSTAEVDDVFEAGETIFYEMSSNDGPHGNKMFDIYQWSPGNYPVNFNLASQATVSGQYVISAASTNGRHRIRASDVWTSSTVTVTCEARDALSDATLSSLWLSDSSGNLALTPSFSPSHDVYDATTTANGTVNVTAMLADTNAKMTLDGAPISSGTATPLTLSEGSNSFAIAVTAEDETTEKTYTLNVQYDPVDPLAVVSPDVSVLPQGTVGEFYTQTFTAEGGVLPYKFVIGGDHAPGMSIHPDTGVYSGTPQVQYDFNFTVLVTDATGAYIGRNYDFPVKAVQTPGNDIAFTRPEGPLPQAMPGEDYSVSLAATGGSGTLGYSISGQPKGLIINYNTGLLSGAPIEGTEGDYTITVTASHGPETASATYTLTVTKKGITVTDKTVNVPQGATPPNVDLTEGATGGPFVAAEIVSVEPANAGTAEIVHARVAQAGGPAPVEFYLKFTPNPAYSGPASVRFRLTSALGISDLGTVLYTLSYDPVALARDVDASVRGFVQTRQNLLFSSINVPGLLERRARAAGSGTTSALTPNGDGLELAFATSLTQMRAAEVGGDVSPFDLWIEGTFRIHNRDQNGDDWGTFGLISAGAEYLLDDKTLVGISVHLDHISDPLENGTDIAGTGWLAGPYASFELGEGVFLDTSLLFGGSSNTIDLDFFYGDFDTRRMIWDTTLSGQWRLDEATILTPRLRAFYARETVEDYRTENDAGDALDLPGFTEEQLRVSIGAELERAFDLGNGMVLTPNVGLTGGVTGLDGNGMFGSVTTGFSLSNGQPWRFDAGLTVDFDDDGYRSTGIRFGLGGSF